MSARTIRFWSDSGVIRPFNRAVLRNALGRNNRSEGLALVYELARLPARERQRLIDIAEFMREMPPRLPDDPTSEQVDGWVELAELVSDDDFRRATRQMVLRGETDNRIEFGLNIRPTVLEHARPAAEQGIAPGSDAGHVILDRIVPADLGDAEAQALLDWLDLVAEPRVGRYWELVSLLNNRPPEPRSVPAFPWLAAALRAHRQRGGHNPRQRCSAVDRNIAKSDIARRIGARHPTSRTSENREGLLPNRPAQGRG